MFSTPDDAFRCKLIVQIFLERDGIVLENEKLDEIVKAVLNITYATGGDYTNQSLEDYAKMYLQDNLNKYK